MRQAHPAGIKLNSSLSSLLSSITITYTYTILNFITIIYNFLIYSPISYISSHVPSFVPIPASYPTSLLLLLLLLPFPLLLAIVCDMISIFSLTIRLPLLLLSFLFRSLTSTLYHQFLLFRGYKYNPLKQRIDSYPPISNKYVYTSSHLTRVPYILTTIPTDTVFSSVTTTSTYTELNRRSDSLPLTPSPSVSLPTTPSSTDAELIVIGVAFFAVSLLILPTIAVYYYTYALIYIGIVCLQYIIQLIIHQCYLLRWKIMHHLPVDDRLVALKSIDPLSPDNNHSKSDTLSYYYKRIVSSPLTTIKSLLRGHVP